MKRKIDVYLQKWIQDSPERESQARYKCLLIKGLRQTGKSYAVRSALSLPVDKPTVVISYPVIPSWPSTIAIEVNLSFNSALKSAFEDSSDALSILKKIQQDPLFFSADLHLAKDHRVILFIDEIQESPAAIKALKFLSFQPYLTVIASGSLLGVSVQGADLFPTGYVDIVRLYPMDFEEFLWAHGLKEDFITNFVNEIKENRALLPSLHEELLRFYREYIVAGGLPENVKIALEKGISSPELYANQRSLLFSYVSDIAKYAPKEERLKAQQVFETIPNALARTNSRFTYSLLGKGMSASRYEGALEWLLKAGLIYRVNNLEEPVLPLKSKTLPGDFKLYLADSGILWAMLGNQNAQALLDPASEFQKGMIYENSTAAMLEMSKVLDERDVYYFERNSTLEVDFLIETATKALVVEAKSSLNTKSKSVATLLKEYPHLYAVKVSPKNPGRGERLYLLPHYCLPFLDQIIG
jgi:predicted AAA+ superfamily ATPase